MLSEALSLSMPTTMAVMAVFLVSASLSIGLVAFILLGSAVILAVVSFLVVVVTVSLESSFSFVLKIGRSQFICYLVIIAFTRNSSTHLPHVGHGI